MRFSCAIAGSAIMKKRSKNYTFGPALIVVPVPVPTLKARAKTAPTKEFLLLAP